LRVLHHNHQHKISHQRRIINTYTQTRRNNSMSKFQKDSWRDFNEEELNIINKEREVHTKELDELLAKFPIDKFEVCSCC
jgi:hypothetical protein